MQTEDLEALKCALLELQHELESTAEVSAEAGRPVALDQTSVGRLSRMDAMLSQGMALEANRRRLAQLARIEGALRRMEQGDFGVCYVCGESIDIRRLRADPTVTRCIGCEDL